MPTADPSPTSGAADGPEEPGGLDDQPQPPSVLWVAAFVIWIQAAAMLGLAVVLAVKAVTGHPHSLAAALFGALLAVLAAVVMIACGRGMLSLQALARTPVVVIELVAVLVSYTITFSAHRVGYGAPIFVSAIVVLYLLFTPAARRALDREI